MYCKVCEGTVHMPGCPVPKGEAVLRTASVKKMPKRKGAVRKVGTAPTSHMEREFESVLSALVKAGETDMGDGLMCRLCDSAWHDEGCPVLTAWYVLGNRTTYVCAVCETNMLTPFAHYESRFFCEACYPMRDNIVQRDRARDARLGLT